MRGSGLTTQDTLTQSIIDAIIRVHNVLGPGFVESVYQKSLAVELSRRGIPITTELDIPIHYGEETVGRHRLDLVVANRVIVELKTVEVLHRVHYAQVRSYLKATGWPVALLVNFAGERADYRRITLAGAASPPHPPSSPSSPFSSGRALDSDQ